MKSKNIKEKIKEHYFIHPNSKMRVREIERTLKLPLPSVIRYCKELAHEGILTAIKTGSVVFYTSDKTNPNFVLEKKLYNIHFLYTCGLVEFLKMELSNPAIVVFGSYSKGEDNEDSDIDIYIETVSNKNINLKKFESILKRNIQTFRHKSINDVKNPALANNIINGIALNGYIEVFK